MDSEDLYGDLEASVAPATFDQVRKFLRPLPFAALSDPVVRPLTRLPALRELQALSKEKAALEQQVALLQAEVKPLRPCGVFSTSAAASA